MSAEEIQHTLGELAKIEKGTRMGEYELAMWVKKLTEKYGLHTRRVMTRDLKILPNTAGAYLRQLELLECVPEREVWIAVGKAEVKHLAPLEESHRARVITKLLKARDQHGVVPQYRAKEIMRATIPGYGVKEEEEKEKEADSRPARSKDGAVISKALRELRHILETYDLGSYTCPKDVVELLNAQIEEPEACAAEA